MFNEGDFILAQAKKNRETIYGARALKKHLGFLGLGRATSDWDVFSPKPKKSAQQLDRTLDKSSGGNHYFVKPAVHVGTYKVKDKGFDNKANTDDDRNVADYSQMRPQMRTVVKDGVRYQALSEVVKDRRRILTEKEYAYRHNRDKYDLALIKQAKSIRR